MHYHLMSHHFIIDILTHFQSDLLETITLLDGVKAERAEKKESKEEYSIKIHNPLNKNYVPLFLATDSEAELVDWLKELQKSVDIGMLIIDMITTFTHTQIIYAYIHMIGKQSIRLSYTI